MSNLLRNHHFVMVTWIRIICFGILRVNFHPRSEILPLLLPRTLYLKSPTQTPSILFKFLPPSPSPLYPLFWMHIHKGIGLYVHMEFFETRRVHLRSSNEKTNICMHKQIPCETMRLYTLGTCIAGSYRILFENIIYSFLGTQGVRKINSRQFKQKWVSLTAV